MADRHSRHTHAANVYIQGGGGCGTHMPAHAYVRTYLWPGGRNTPTYAFGTHMPGCVNIGSCSCLRPRPLPGNSLAPV